MKILLSMLCLLGVSASVGLAEDYDFERFKDHERQCSKISTREECLNTFFGLDGRCNLYFSPNVRCYFEDR
ncbi:MAG: hypothetical protein CNLJKLNK_01252 [Holosporales bacterium]